MTDLDLEGRACAYCDSPATGWTRNSIGALWPCCDEHAAGTLFRLALPQPGADEDGFGGDAPERVVTTDPAVTAAAEALSIIGGVPDIWDLRAAGIAVAAARPIIEAEERERIAADIEARADEDGTWVGPTDPDSILRLAARIARGQA